MNCDREAELIALIMALAERLAICSALLSKCAEKRK